jgi:hypothetical protein
LLAAKGRLRHRTSRGPDKHRHTVNELRTHGGACIWYTAEALAAKSISFRLNLSIAGWFSNTISWL